ncbi:restriction endonuclease subunit R [Microbacterium sp. XT11]|uniref:restriction endonuclease subunit R n=1 Tax=Microbacterium sp. XT11 TaxID=367477 RepID=UPI000742F78E|nr:restriction endonuclease subunit R [Microbacterium sp. XT11]ALX66613.1 type I site-specific restriction-modification system,R (restriction) subunit [Microbacterium sp. XT11]
MSLPDGWELSASAFNLTPEIVRAERTASDLTASLVERGIASAIELELGQMSRDYPEPSLAGLSAFRERLAQHGGRVSIVGVSLDEFVGGRRRSDAERRAFLEPQLRAAAAAGATGVRLPIGQAGALLDGLIPLLEDLDLVLYEEIQGHQTPTDPVAAPAYARVAELDTPHVRLLLDISLLMPALPVTYLDHVERAGLSPVLVRRLRDDWRDPGTHAAVVDELRAGRVPGTMHALFMDLLVRFGRSHVDDLREVLPLIGGIHLKFWDLDDADARISQPIRDVGRALRDVGYRGTLCSEWGGQEWLDDDPWDMTVRHLSLAAGILSDPVTDAASPLEKARTR